MKHNALSIPSSSPSPLSSLSHPSLFSSSSYDFRNCTLCPRACGANRLAREGFCGVGAELKIARAALHFWEEPCISGKEGSGAIFFSGCPLGCVFCQNREIRSGKVGKNVSVERLREICFELKAQGANNINLVTPMHFAPQIREALLPIKKELALPIVVNTGGYDSAMQLDFFKGLADIWLPDFKFFGREESAAFASAPDYAEVCIAALVQMFRQVGKPSFDRRGMLQKGVMVRHLILPSKRKDSIAILKCLSSLFRKDEILLSLMSQYSPMPNAAVGQHPQSAPNALECLRRRITTFEQQSVAAVARELDFEGYTQERSSASADFIPPFDLTGV